jgi:hypothetical protein
MDDDCGDGDEHNREYGRCRHANMALDLSESVFLVISSAGMEYGVEEHISGIHAFIPLPHSRW